MPIDPVIGGSIIGAAATGIGNLIQAGNSRRTNKRNVENWKMQNAYNSPSAQMARLREAGLNPNLIYGGGGSQAVGNADKPSPAPNIPFDNPVSDITRFADVAQKNAIIDNLREQNTVTKQEGILKASQVVGQNQSNANAAIQLGIAPELANISLQASQETLRQLELKTIDMDLSNEIKARGKENVLKKLSYEVANARETLKGKDLENKLKQFEADLNKLGLTKSDPLYSRIMYTGAKALPNMGEYFGNDEYGIPKN